MTLKFTWNVCLIDVCATQSNTIKATLIINILKYMVKCKLYSFLWYFYCKQFCDLLKCFRQVNWTNFDKLLIKSLVLFMVCVLNVLLTWDYCLFTFYFRQVIWTECFLLKQYCCLFMVWFRQVIETECFTYTGLLFIQGLI